MQMKNFFQVHKTRIDALLWSLWSELGVPGWERNHAKTWLDPEALIVFTASCEAVDPRLREEALEWSLNNRRFVSLSRLRYFSKKFGIDDATKLRIARFLSTIGVTSDSKAQPYDVVRRRTNPAPIADRASLLSLQLRCLLGVSARAEIIRFFVCRPELSMNASDFVFMDVGYTKRAVRDALQDLRAGGFVDVQRTGNQNRFSLATASRIRSLFDSPSLVFPVWGSLFLVLRILIDLGDRLEGFRPATRQVEVRRVLAKAEPIIHSAGLAAPETRNTDDVIHETEAWICSVFDSLHEPAPHSGWLDPV